MEQLDIAFVAALIQIIGIDLVLAGDNAVVIALAARNLPPRLQRRAVVFGALAAVVLRIILTAGVATLLEVPYLKLIGGLVLLRIAWQLATEGEADEEAAVNPADNLRAAIITILMADVVMSLDNVLAVAGAAEATDHKYELIVFGLIVSIPIVMGGATLLLRLVQRFPGFVWLGASLIAYTALKLVLDDEHVHGLLALDASWTSHAIALIGTAVLMGAAWLATRPTKAPPDAGEESESAPRSGSGSSLS